MQPFKPVPTLDVCYPTIVAAKLAIANELATPLAKLSEQHRQFIDNLLLETLARAVVLAQIRGYCSLDKRTPNDAYFEGLEKTENGGLTPTLPTIRGIAYFTARLSHKLRPPHTYIPMQKEFMYLIAVMDWATRKVLSWRLSNTLDTRFCVEALKEALFKYGAPEIFNTDQGCQFTSCGAGNKPG